MNVLSSVKSVTLTKQIECVNGTYTVNATADGTGNVTVNANRSYTAEVAAADGSMMQTQNFGGQFILSDGNVTINAMPASNDLAAVCAEFQELALYMVQELNACYADTAAIADAASEVVTE